MSAFGTNRKRTDLEVQQQGVRADIVGAQRFTVELRRVVGVRFEKTAVLHQIAVDFAHAERAQPAQQQPEILQCQLGIAVAFENQVALEYVALQLAAGIGLRLPCVAGTEQFQRRIGGEKFHGRGRIHRLRGIAGKQRLRAIDVLHVDSDGGQGDMGALQGQFDRRRQGLRQARLQRKQKDEQNAQEEDYEGHGRAKICAAMIRERVT